MKKFPQSGYSWLGIGYENVQEEGLLTPWQKSRIDSDIETLDHVLYSLENKVHRYTHLCKTYEKEAGTKRAEGILNQIEHLRKEIDLLSKTLSKAVQDTIEVMHFKNAP